MQNKPTILADYSAWHKAECLSELKSRLERKGYEVITPQLPSCSNTLIDQPMQTDNKLVRQTATELIEPGNELLVVLHSYGGIVSTNSLYGLGVQQRKQEGKKGGIRCLAYMCAFMPVKGESLYTERGG